MRELIKSFFYTDPLKFPLHFLDLVLPASIKSLYFDYYFLGTGKICFQIILSLSLIHFIFSRKSRIISVFFFLTILIFTPSAQGLIVQYTTYATNIFHLPLIQINPILLIIFYSVYAFFLQIFFFRKIRYYLSPRINLLLIVGVVIFNFLLFLPIFTGEIWH